jgi:hypothetical protein
MECHSESAAVRLSSDGCTLALERLPPQFLLRTGKAGVHIAYTVRPFAMAAPGLRVVPADQQQGERSA